MTGTHDRGVSSALSHVLVIAITALFVSGLLVGLGSLVESERSASIRDQLQTIGHRVADELQRVDALVAGGGNVSVTTRHPARVSGEDYTMEIVPTSECDQSVVPRQAEACLELEAVESDVTVQVPLDNRTELSIERRGDGVVALVADRSGSAVATGRQRPVQRLSPRTGVAGNIEDSGFDTSFREFNAKPEPVVRIRPEFPTSDTQVTFNGSGSYDPEGSIVTYRWDVDSDGNYELTGERVTTTLDPGRYRVTLAVTDDEGATVTSAPTNLTVSGLEYRGDLTAVDPDSDGVDGGLSFTLYNEWNRPVTLSELLVDPREDSIDTFHAQSGVDEVAIDVGDDGSVDGTVNLDDGDFTVPDPGLILDVDQPDSEGMTVSGSRTIPANTPVEVVVADFETEMDDENITVATDYLIGGGTNTTRFVDTTAPGISNYALTAVGRDVDLSFVSSRQLQDVTVEVGGAIPAGTLTRSDFTESSLGGSYRYTADVSDSVTGQVYANLTLAESTGGIESPDPPVNDTAIATLPTYYWDTATDWDNNRENVNVVHDGFGDRQAGEVSLGYPDFDRRAVRNGHSPSLLGYWTFDADSGDTVADVTGNGFDAEVQGYGSTDASNNDPTREVTGIHGTSTWKFNADSGSEDEVFVDDDDALDGGDGLELTASAWVNFGGSVDIDTPGGKASIIGKIAGPDDADWALVVYDESCPGWAECEGSPPYVGYYGEKNGNRYGLFAEVPADSQWHHVAINVNDGSDEVEVAVDGVEVANTFSAPESYTTATSHPVEMGRTEAEDANLEAKIDEVRLYGRELTDDEIESLHEAGTSGHFVTSVKSGPELDIDDLSLTHDGEIGTGESVTVTVYARDSPGYYVPVDTVTLTSDSGVTELSPGYSMTSERFVLEVQLASSSPANSPVIDSLGLVDTS